MIDVRLTREIEIGAKARPRYSTDVIVTDGGHEVRNQRWSYPLFEFDFDLEPGDRDGDTHLADADRLSAFIDLWHVAAGQFNSFKFRDWGDWDVETQPFATGDGITTAFQLYRVYQAGNMTRLRKITRPVQGSVTAYVNGAPTAISVDHATGIVTFTGGAPADGAVITADFQFDLPVRFADDTMDLIAIMKDLDKPTNITLIEIRE